ncbi:MAG: DUF2922 domain-containing protein [Sarcina sp.]
MNTIYTLSMTFKNEAGKNSVITLKNVKPDITNEQVQNAMDTIVASNLFITPLGNIVSAVSADLVEKAVTEFELS